MCCCYYFSPVGVSSDHSTAAVLTNRRRRLSNPGKRKCQRSDCCEAKRSPLKHTRGWTADLEEQTVTQHQHRANCQHDKCVLFRWHPGFRAAAHLHMCIPQKGSTHQQLAAVREERSMGCFLQSGGNWDKATHRCGSFLLDHGFLHYIPEMIIRVWEGLAGLKLGMD